MRYSGRRVGRLREEADGGLGVGGADDETHLRQGIAKGVVDQHLRRDAGRLQHRARHPGARLVREVAQLDEAARHAPYSTTASARTGKLATPCHAGGAAKNRNALPTSFSRFARCSQITMPAPSNIV